MSPGFVVDSSVAVSWLVESQADHATEQLRKQAITGTEIFVPLLWRWEVSNSLLSLFQRRRLTETEWSNLRIAASMLPIEVDDLGALVAFDSVSKLAADHALTVYDAAYLELSMRLNLSLASRDAALNKAARKCGVKTLL